MCQLYYGQSQWAKYGKNMLPFEENYKGMDFNLGKNQFGFSKSWSLNYLYILFSVLIMNNWL